jgi:hypothetical protein
LCARRYGKIEVRLVLKKKLIKSPRVRLDVDIGDVRIELDPIVIEIQLLG